MRTRSLQPPTGSVNEPQDLAAVPSDGVTAGAIMVDVDKIEALRKASAFPDLDCFDTISRRRETYLGPTMESNWVLPGKLLVGAYPASIDDDQHAHLLCGILLEGVSTFVCLQQEYLAEGVTEDMWKSGKAIRPYYQDVLQLLKKLQELRRKNPQVYPSIIPPEKADFVHFPIVDCDVADDAKVLQLALQLSSRVASGEVMYLHCWGGHGRTGTVVSIMLHLMYGLGAKESMERCQFVHDVRRVPIDVGSPQTESQRQQVERIIKHLAQHWPKLQEEAPPAPAQEAPRRNNPEVGAEAGAGARGGAAGSTGQRKRPGRLRRRAMGSGELQGVASRAAPSLSRATMAAVGAPGGQPDMIVED
ncbi:unnamed protein product, partial [Discosporangium mesarthrocarpum]